MAAVLDAMAPYVKNLIADMTKEEVDMLLGVSSEIKKLENNTEGLKCFLADAERRRITDQSIQRWVTKLKGAMYDATDILDVCRLEADKWKESKCYNSKEGNCFWSLLFCLRNPAFSHKIGSRIKELNQQLDDIHKEANNFNLSINLGSNQEPRNPAATDTEVCSQSTTSEFVQSDIVGDRIEKDTKELVQELITNENKNLNIKVVSIVGMGGIGKTTLAQKIFKEKTIEGHFKTRIWLSITQHFDQTKLLRTAIEQAGGDHGSKEDKTLLTRTLTDVLSKGQFLLVMDDMWGVEAWSHVLRASVMNASNEQPGSRVLITTRLDDLAPQFQAFFHPHRVSLLDNEDAWSLLKKQLSPNQVAKIDELKDTIGMKILERCNGLPLAVKVVGGLLSTRHPSEREWLEVLNHHAWSVAGLPPELDRRLYMSYEDLSPQLKQCFLYCSLFPKGESIFMTSVTSMWISEGFIHESHQSGDGLEEVATKYHKELIKRNLIEPEEGALATGYRCTMHDVVRSFAEFMAREESLVVFQDMKATANCTSGAMIRRICINQTTIPIAEYLQKQKSLRTLIIMSSTKIIRLHDFVGTFYCLRVLHIVHAECGGWVHFLSQLKHLRYLHLKDTDISRLPDDIHKMKSLEHISLVDCKKLMGPLPTKIIELKHLRCLDIDASNANVVPKGFAGLTNLRKLYGFPVHYMDMDVNRGWCSLQEIGPLSQLRSLGLFGLENVSASLLAEKAAISTKVHLSYLDLYCNTMESRDEMEQQRAAEEVFQALCPPSCIEDVRLHGYLGGRLPNWMMVQKTTGFKSLWSLILEDMPCCTQLPDGLCRLPSLEFLTIKDAPSIKKVGPEFQASSSAIAFPSMTYLRLKGLCEWEEWDWEDDMAMPALKMLIINNCKLSRLPPGLASSKRHALRELYLYELTNVTYVDNFPWVVDLDVFDCPKLKRISGLPMLQKITIFRCPNLKVLEEVPTLDSLELRDPAMETLPEYLRGVNPRYLKLECSRKLSESISPNSPEWDKIKHILNRNIIYVD